MTGMGGFEVGDIEKGARPIMADMLKREEDYEGKFDDLVIKDPCDGAYNLHLGYKRVGLPRRWRFGDALPMTATGIWTKKFYPVLYGLGAEMNIDDQTVLDGRMVRSVADELTQDLVGSLPEFNNQSFIDCLTGTTTTLEDGLDLTAYDGASLYSSAGTRFGLAYGNIDNRFSGTSPDNITDQIFGYIYDFVKMRDEHGKPFHRQVINAQDVTIITSVDYWRSWQEAVHASFYPRETAAAAVYSPVASTMGKGVLGSPTVIPDSRLSGRDHYGFLRTSKFKAIVDTYYEFKASENNVLTSTNENPLPNPGGSPGGSFYQLRRTSPNDFHALKYGVGAIGLFFKKVRGVGRPQTTVKMDVAA